MAIQDDSSVALIPSAYGTSKVYSVIPSNGNGDFDFSRSGNATRVNKGGYIETMGSNVPRLDYPLIDGVVQDCPALLLEPSRTNLSEYSESFNNWSGGLATANQAISPDGNLTADKLTKTGSFSAQSESVTGTSGNNYVFSVFVKADTGTNITLRQASGSNDVRRYFQLSDETSGSSGGNQTGFVSEKIEKYPNGWYRVSTVCTANGTTISTNIYAGRAGSTTYDGNIFIWGSQVEEADYETSYIPNLSTGSTTRSADTCNGSGTSAEFNDSEGVLFIETSMLSSNPNNSTFQIDDGTSTNRVRIRFTTTTNQINGLLYSGVSGQPNINYTANDVTNQNKVAIRYQVGQIDLFFNGFEVGTSTGNATPTGFDNLSLGTEGDVKQLMTFKTALTDSELETLTSWDSFNAMAKGQLYTIE